jgi:hypothetical protein
MPILFPVKTKKTEEKTKKEACLRGDGEGGTHFYAGAQPLPARWAVVRMGSW